MRLLILLISLLSLTRSAAADLEQSLKWDGRQRGYVLHLPGNPPKSGKMPLVLLLHGGGGNAEQVKKYTKFNALADMQQFAVVYPEGIGKGWNDGRVIPGHQASQESVDDCGFLCALVEHLARKYPIDKSRVYATGISNGGHMSYRLAIERPDVFAAVCGVVANVPESLAGRFPLKEAISVMVINGEDDPLVPYQGGEVTVAGKKRGRDLSTEESVLLFARSNGCKLEAQTVRQPDIDPLDKTTIVSKIYSGGRGGTEVVLHTVKGGGHAWPGASQYLPIRMIGRASRDMDANTVIWAFFKKHRRSG